MSDVTIIGLGVMGSALARALRGRGHAVTVWNRTTSRTEPLRALGAVVAPTASEAAGSSPVVIVCVDDYDVTEEILGAPEVAAVLSGRTIVQLSTGTPQQARDGEQWATLLGAVWLDGAILAYPDQIGTPDAAILLAGDEAAWQRCAPVLQALAGGLTYVGPAVGAASALDCATLSFMIGAFLGLVHGARICEVEGLRVDEFGGMLAGLMPVFQGEVVQLATRIHEERFTGTVAALGTYAAAAARLEQQATDAGIPRDVPACASALLRRATAAGLAQADLAALITVMRS